MSKKVGISIDEEIHKEGKEFAESTGRTFSGLVEIALQEKLPEGESDEKTEVD